jgi:hypothetical protein
MAQTIRNRTGLHMSGSDSEIDSDFHVSPHEPRLSRQVQAQLGQRLRLFYETLKLGEQPVPERFIELIDRLDSSPREERS